MVLFKVQRLQHVNNNFRCNMIITSVATLATLLSCSSYALVITSPPNTRRLRPFTPLFGNIYDEWRSDMTVDTVPLDDEFVQICLEEMIYSDHGEEMFGIHDRAASIGITGEISLVDIDGPEVILSLSGKFWHTRSYVLGRAAMYLNARIPEVTRVSVFDPDELNDFEEIVDEDTGEVIKIIDRRAPDFNGDRETMTYQGINPDMRGPFPGGSNGEFKINPA